MRLALSLIALAFPAQAWEFSAAPVCTLSHETAEASLRITRDPSRAEPYAITITTAEPWPDAASFAIRYEGARPFTIATERHRLSENGRTLTVTDTGFSNVLDGIEFNAKATALSGSLALPFALDGARGPLRDFRACGGAPVS
jgi:hypothetical protein